MLKQYVLSLQSLFLPALLCLLSAGCADAQIQKAQSMREWTDSSGQYKVVAAFDGVVDGNVKLLKQDGGSVLVPLARFSAADRQYLTTLLNQSTQATSVSNTSSAGIGWNTFLGPNGNNTSSETGLISEFPSNGPKILWKTELGSGFSGLTIGQGKVFTLYGKSGRELVACFDASNGKELWTFDSDADFAEGRSNGPRSTPALDGPHLYAVGASGRVVCLSSSNGKLVWYMNLYEKYSMEPHNEGLSPSPLIDGEKMILTGETSVSGLYQRCTIQSASQDPDFYRPLLDILWNQFGSDRLIYGSNWPCTKKSGDYKSFVTLVNGYFAAKGQEASEKYFWGNAAKVYKLNLK